DRPDMPPEPERAPLVNVPYSPLRTLAPRAFGVELAPGDYSQSALKLSTYGEDVAGFHAFEASVIADFAAPGPRMNLAYFYKRLPVDLGLRLSHAIAPRTLG